MITGVPIFINWKNHPWTVDNLLTWYDRIQLADRFYDQAGEEQCQMLDELVAEFGITHVVMPAGQRLDCSDTPLMLTIKPYRVFAVQ
jgi:hypothetical protein